MDFTVEVGPGSNAIVKLQKLESSLMDWRQAFAVLGAAFKDYYSSVPFASRGTVYGPAWPEYQIEGYESWKAEQYPGRGVLELTGKMRKSFDFTTTRESVKLFNTDSKKFAAHQLGINHPQRVMMALNQERKDTAVEILRKELFKKMEAL